MVFNYFFVSITCIIIIPICRPEFVAKGILKLLEDKINGSTLLVTKKGYTYIGYQDEFKDVTIWKRKKISICEHHFLKKCICYSLYYFSIKVFVLNCEFFITICQILLVCLIPLCCTIFLKRMWTISNHYILFITNCKNKIQFHRYAIKQFKGE